MYRQYITHEEYDEIVNEDYGDEDTYPHCSTTCWHEPGVCAFCDGYYRRYTEFVPTQYTAREANGWGGNVAPEVDDEKAEAEQLAYRQLFAKYRAPSPFGGKYYD